MVRKPRRVDQLGTQIGTDATPDPIVMQAVYVGATCVGFVYSRGKAGVEAFDVDTHSLGTFPDMKAGADAVTKAAGGAA